MRPTVGAVVFEGVNDAVIQRLKINIGARGAVLDDEKGLAIIVENDLRKRRPISINAV